MSMILRHEERTRAATRRLARGNAAERPVQYTLRGPQEPQPPSTPLSPLPERQERPVVLQPSALPVHAAVPVFSINFARGQTLSLRVRRLMVGMSLVYLAVNALVTVSLAGTALSAHQQWRALHHPLQRPPAPMDAISGVGTEMATLQARAKKDLAQLTAIIAQHRQRFPVGGKLAALTKTLPPRTWITGLAGRREGRRITVQAAYLVDPNAPYELPMKGWIEALRADPSFGRGLKRLDLQSSARKTQGTAKLVTFELVAEWQASPVH